MAETTELVMRGGRFIRKVTRTEEQDIGSQVELLQKLLPRPASTVHNIGTINWREKSAPVHMLHSGNKLAAFAEIPTIGPRCVYSPIWNLKGSEMASKYGKLTVDEKADFMKKIHEYVERWDPQFSRSSPGTPFEVITRADVPWNVRKFGPLLFIIVFDSTIGPDIRMTGLRSFYYTGTYMAALANKELAALDLVNHFDDGRVCMGGDFDGRYNTGSRLHCSVLEFVQLAADSYNTTQSNNHLHHLRMNAKWCLNPERNNVLDSPDLLKGQNLSLPFMMGLI